MGLVVFSIVLGLVLAFMDEEGRPVREFFESLQIAIQNIVTLVIWSAHMTSQWSGHFFISSLLFF